MLPKAIQKVDPVLVFTVVNKLASEFEIHIYWDYWAKYHMNIICVKVNLFIKHLLNHQYNDPCRQEAYNIKEKPRVMRFPIWKNHKKHIIVIPSLYRWRNNSISILYCFGYSGYCSSEEISYVGFRKPHLFTISFVFRTKAMGNRYPGN